MAFTFLASLDSKGRLTVPSEIRGRYALDEGDRLRVSIRSVEVERFEVEDVEGALELLDEFDGAESFSYSDGVLEVVRRV
ncbi:MAG: hypothetical protein ABEJ62_00885 [Candidatus Nanohaloarchaea archaeon]